MSEELDQLKDINRKLDALAGVIIEYITRAEKEVPEYLRRLTMYYSDMVHAKYLWEDSGQQMPAELRDEIDRTHHRLLECIAEETSQGGTFHAHAVRFAKEGKNFSRRKTP